MPGPRFCVSSCGADRSRGAGGDKRVVQGERRSLGVNRRAIVAVRTVGRDRGRCPGEPGNGGARRDADISIDDRARSISGDGRAADDCKAAGRTDRLRHAVDGLSKGRRLPRWPRLPNTTSCHGGRFLPCPATRRRQRASIICKSSVPFSSDGLRARAVYVDVMSPRCSVLDSRRYLSR